MSSRNDTDTTTATHNLMKSNRYASAVSQPYQATISSGGNYQKIDICDNNATNIDDPISQVSGSSSNRAVAPVSVGFAADIPLASQQQQQRFNLLNGGANNHGPADRRANFKSLLLPSAVINNSDETNAPTAPMATTSTTKHIDPKRNQQSELIDLTSFNRGAARSRDTTGPTAASSSIIAASTKSNATRPKDTLHLSQSVRQTKDLITNDRDSNDSDQCEHENFFDGVSGDENEYFDEEDDHDDDDDDDENNLNENQLQEAGELSVSPSHHKLKSRRTSLLARLYRQVQHLGSDFTSKITGSSSASSVAYTPYLDANQSTTTSGSAGTRKYRRLSKQARNLEQNFRGSYRYSRIGIVMTIIKKLLGFLIQRSTLALIGAFLIHVTLGTIYTLSNINSYLTSYMRKHGSPQATYGGSMWISSSHAVGQGISMVLGGIIERRFSARVSCIIGCLLHSMSIMSTSKSIEYGQLAVLLTYGFLPGFGCGLAYMTPMSNGFGWFPHRKGLVAGVILAGFGIGTFVFNMAQTAYVNPNNLSPPKEAGGYFTQDAVLINVPHLFVFLGTIYATMQFIGCCLLFKPPSPQGRGSLVSDERPILAETEMPFRKAIRSREFIVLFLVFGITNQGVLFVNAMLKEYGQLFIADDLYLAWTGSMASIANSLGRLGWGMAIDQFTFTQCFTSITTIFGALIFLMPFEFILSNKFLYLLCTLGIFGSFSGWMSTYPVHLSRVFGLSNSGMIYGLIFVSQSLGGIMTAFAAHYLIDQYSRFVPFFCVTLLEIFGLAIYHLFYENK